MRRPNRGFTLLEILLVVLVIGLGSTLAVLSLGAPDEQAGIKAATGQFVRSSRLALDVAIMSGEPQGLFLQPVAGNSEAGTDSAFAYYWASYRDLQWQTELPLTDATALPAVQITLEVDGQPLQPERYLTDRRSLPLAVIYPDGEVTRLSLRLATRDSRYWQEVVISQGGDIGWHDSENPDDNE